MRKFKRNAGRPVAVYFTEDIVELLFREVQRTNKTASEIVREALFKVYKDKLEEIRKELKQKELEQEVLV